MTEPFVFHFKPGADGTPEAMYMLDLDCRCGLCRHEQFQRFYHSTPFHELTIPGLEQLVDRGSLKAGYQCENCGEAVGSDDVRHVRLAYGFSDDAGVIRIFDDPEGGERRVELTPRRRLDPQAVPRWSADPEAFGEGHRVVERLDEPTVENVLDRPFNVKLAWRDVLTDRIDGDSTGVVTRRISPELWCVIADDEESARAAVGELEVASDADWQLVALDESTPTGLPLHADPADLAGRWRRWLPGRVVEAIDEDRCWVGAWLSASAVVEVVDRTFEVGRLDVEYDERDGDFVYCDIETPTEVVFDGELPVSSIVRRAVYTGLTPGEAARLSAEEIVGRLMKVW